MRNAEGMRLFDRASWQRKARVPRRFHEATEQKRRWPDERTNETQGV